MLTTEDAKLVEDCRNVRQTMTDIATIDAYERMLNQAYPSEIAAQFLRAQLKQFFLRRTKPEVNRGYGED